MISLLDSLYPGDEMTFLVVNVLIQITAVMLLTMLFVRRVPRHAAVVRHAAWLVCLTFVAACPLMTLAARRAGLSIVSLPLARKTVARAETEGPAGPVAVAPKTIGARHFITPRPVDAGTAFSSADDTFDRMGPARAERLRPSDDPRLGTTDRMTPAAIERRSGGVPSSVTPDPRPPEPTGLLVFRSAVSLCVTLWAAGALLLAVRLVHGGLCLWKLSRTTLPLDESALSEVLDRVRDSLGVAHLPPILLSDQISTPVVAALPRPTILLPASLPDSVTRDGLHNVLVHECAHVVRHDHWVGVLQRLVELLYWPHPLIYHMNRQIARCREEVCDNHVLSVVGGPNYADTLLELACLSRDRASVLGVIGMFRLHWNLEDRVRGLLDSRRDRRVRLSHRARLAALVCVFVVLAAAPALRIDLAAEENDTGPVATQADAAGEENAEASANTSSGGDGKTLATDISHESERSQAGVPRRSALADGQVLDVDGNPQKPGHDLDGEPLPRGAVARLGSRRLRHDGFYKRICMLPDNDTLISSSWEKGVRVWSAATGRLLRALDLEGARFTAMDLSHDGTSLAVFGRTLDPVRRESTCEVRLWDTSTWQARPVASWTGSISDNKCVAVSPDATMIATGNERGQVRFWDVASGEELLDYSVAQRSVESLAFSPDGSHVAVATREGVFLWDWLSGNEPEELEGAAEDPQAVAFSPDGRLLATGGRGAFAARIWDVASRREVSRLKGDQRHYYREGLIFSSDGKLLIVPANDTKTVEIFDVETGRLQRILDAGRVEPRDVAVSSDGRLLAAIGSKAAIKLWDLSTGECLSDRFIGHDEAAYEVVFMPDGQHVVTGGPDETIRVWDAATGRQLRLWELHGWASSVAVSPDGKRIASCGLDDRVRLWDFESGRQIFELPGHGRTGGSGDYVVRFNRAATRFLTFGPDLYLRVWSAQTGKAIAEHAIRPSGIKLAATQEGTLRLADPSSNPFGGGGLTEVLQQARFTDNTDRLFLSARLPDGHAIHVFDTASGREIDTWTPEDALSTFRIAPDGGTLVTIETRRTTPDSTASDPSSTQTQHLLKVYQWPSKERVREIELAGSVGEAVSFSPGGRLVATGINSRSREAPTRRWITVWDIETGEEVARVTGYNTHTLRVAFSPDEKRLASTHGDTTTLVWDLRHFQVEGAGRE